MDPLSSHRFTTLIVLTFTDHSHTNILRIANIMEIRHDTLPKRLRVCPRRAYVLIIYIFWGCLQSKNDEGGPGVYAQKSGHKHPEVPVAQEGCQHMYQRTRPKRSSSRVKPKLKLIPSYPKK